MSWSLALFVSLRGGKTVRSPANVFCVNTGLQLVGLQPHASAMSGNDVAHAEFVA